MYQQSNQHIEPTCYDLIFTELYIFNFNYGMYSSQYFYYDILVQFPLAKEGVQNGTTSIFR